MVAALMFGMIFLVFFVIYQSVYEEKKENDIKKKKTKGGDRRFL